MDPGRSFEDKISDSLKVGSHGVFLQDNLPCGQVMLNTGFRLSLDDTSDDTIVNAYISKRRFVNDGIINDNYKLPNITFAPDCKPKDNLRAYIEDIEDIELNFSGTITKVYEFDLTEKIKWVLPI